MIKSLRSTSPRLCKSMKVPSRRKKIKREHLHNSREKERVESFVTRWGKIFLMFSAFQQISLCPRRHLCKSLRSPFCAVSTYSPGSVLSRRKHVHCTWETVGENLNADTWAGSRPKLKFILRQCLPKRKWVINSQNCPVYVDIAMASFEQIINIQYFLLLVNSRYKVCFAWFWNRCACIGNFTKGKQKGGRDPANGPVPVAKWIHFVSQFPNLL